MAGNSIGRFFRVTTFGESHGLAMGVIIDGMPPGFPLCEEDIQSDLNKRRPGSNYYVSQRNEKDKVNILSGVFQGVTTGTSIGILIKNEDMKSEDYQKIKNFFRPNHADYTYQRKYGIRDFRGGGRASARETVTRVAAGSIAKRYLYSQCKITIQGYISQIGNIQAHSLDLKQIKKNNFFWPEKKSLKDLKKLMSDLRSAGDSVGAKITLLINNVPVGLGEPVFNRLNSDLSHALMSINAVKGIEIGDGFSLISKKGSEVRDEITPKGFKSNHSGGILGGISSGQPIIVHLACKPTSSISIPGRTIDRLKKLVKIKIFGRHDPCIGIRAVPIVESMAAIILMDHLLMWRAQCTDAVPITPIR